MNSDDAICSGGLLCFFFSRSCFGPSPVFVSVERPLVPAQAKKEKLHFIGRGCVIVEPINGKFWKVCIAYIWEYMDKTRHNIYELKFIVVDHEIRLESVRYSTVLSWRGILFPLREVLQILADLSNDLMLFKV